MVGRKHIGLSDWNILLIGKHIWKYITDIVGRKHIGLREKKIYMEIYYWCGSIYLALRKHEEGMSIMRGEKKVVSIKICRRKTGTCELQETYIRYVRGKKMNMWVTGNEKKDECVSDVACQWYIIQKSRSQKEVNKKKMHIYVISNT